MECIISGKNMLHVFEYALKTGMQDQHIMLLYDGHRTHITPDIIDWAVEMKIKINKPCFTTYGCWLLWFFFPNI
jgi:hypothetical protein